jgi:TetR/AcrR family transcriptional regulator
VLRSPLARERILAAALSEFAAEGAAGARTARIAARAGVNKQLLHYYFGAKAGLYRAVVEASAGAVAQQLQEMPLVGLTAVERLRRLVRGQFDFFLSNPEHTAVLIGARDEAGWAELAVQPLASLLAAGQATGFFRDDIDTEAHARLALLVTLGYFALGPVTRSWGPPPEWRDRAADLIVRGCTW